MKKIILILASLLIAVTTQADVGPDYKTTNTRSTLTTTKRDDNMERSILFAANETSVDVFGTYAITDPGAYRDGIGGGVGLTHFFGRYFGLGAEGYWWDGDQRNSGLISSFSGSVIARYPFESLRIAPYLFAGGGGNFSQQNQTNLHAGIGLEYRLSQKWGIFADGRHVWADTLNDYNLVRAGVKFIF